MMNKPNIQSKEIYVAFSGGCDSTALLVLSKQWCAEVIAVHFNHGWESSDKIEEHARQVANKLGIKFILGKATTKCPTETQAREARFAFFDTLPHNSTLLLGHNLEEQVETIIFQITRGSKNPTIKQCSTRKSQNGTLNLIRPLLSTPKDQLKQICIDAQVDWLEDPTNNNTDIARNKIRHTIIPVIKGLNANGLEHWIQHFNDSESESEEIFREQLSEQEVSNIVEATSIPCSTLDSLSNTSVAKILKKWLTLQGVQALEDHHIKRCIEVARGARKAWPLPNNLELRRSKQMLAVKQI